MLVIIRPPIIIKIGAMALSGISLTNGSANSDAKNNNPVTIDVRPVFPPAVIPAALSTVDTVGLVPNRPHVIAEIALAW